MAPVTGLHMLRKFCQAVGIDPDAMMVDKLVIEVSVDSAVRVYVRTLMPAESAESVTDLLRVLHVRDVQVSDKGEVSLTSCPGCGCGEGAAHLGWCEVMAVKQYGLLPADPSRSADEPAIVESEPKQAVSTPFFRTEAELNRLRQQSRAYPQGGFYVCETCCATGPHLVNGERKCERCGSDYVRKARP